MSKAKKADNWDPKPHERVWYRSRETGDRGFMVRREGRDMIRLDQPGHEVLRRYTEGNWDRSDETRPLTPAARAMVAFEADRILCMSLGLSREAARHWRDLSDSERIEWIDLGPPVEGIRADLYSAIRDALDGATK